MVMLKTLAQKIPGLIQWIVIECVVQFCYLLVNSKMDISEINKL